MENNTEIILETRTGWWNFLKSTQYEYAILKFYADWCTPCKHIGPKSIAWLKRPRKNSAMKKTSLFSLRSMLMNISICMRF